ncbi:MAG: FHA domain-containing protein [Chitinophagaceae bacterium]|nr:MAG: FHA domain-containing protein [Chitinophagaceae bacterium]
MSNLNELLNSKKTVFIGRSPENDIVIDDPLTSPIHCQVSKIKNGAYMVVDLESESGTFINDKKITKGIAGEYDTIKVGSQVFQLNEPKETATAPTKQQFSSNGEASAPHPQRQQFADIAPQENKATDSSNHLNKNGKGKEKIVVYFMAAPEDEAICEAVHKHLSTIRFSSPLPIEMLGDFKMTGGEDIATYREKINQADIFLAFVSVDFLNNNTCYELLKTAIDNHNKGKAILLPILVRNCMWKTTPFANLPLLPKNQQPLNNKQYWNSEDDALTSVADDIYHSISELTKDSTPHAPIAVNNTTKLKTNWRGNYLWKNFLKRTAAYILDICILVIPIMVVLYLIIGDDYFSEVRETLLFYSLINTSLLVLVYSFFDSSKWRGTPGKAIMKLQITDDAGNPISFGKAFIRNLFKFFLFGFLSSLDESGVVTLLMIVTQIGCYISTRKFIHDYLTYTIIGERLKLETAPVKATNGEEAGIKTVQVNQRSKSMAPTIVGIVALICVVLLVVFKFVLKDNVPQQQTLANNYTTSIKDENLPVTNNTNSEPDEETKESLISAIKYGDATEIEALQKLDASILSRAFTGKQLIMSVAAVNDLMQQRGYLVSTLENQEFHQFKITDEGQKAEVQLSETWSSVLYSLDYNTCVSRIPSHKVSQTAYLEQVNNTWMVNNIIYDNPTQPQAIPCGDAAY